VDNFDVAVVGATGTVGRCMLEILEERKFPVGRVYALASGRSTEKHAVSATAICKWRSWQIRLCQSENRAVSAGAAVSAQHAPRAVASGCVVIDNTSQFRYEPDIPLVVPEVNPQDVALFRKRGIIANPNCSTIQMVVALKPLYDAVGIQRINVRPTNQVSPARADAIEELASQTAQLLNGRPPSQAGILPSRSPSMHCRISMNSRRTAIPARK